MKTSDREALFPHDDDWEYLLEGNTKPITNSHS